jgi:UDP-4-amino-4,6-dideoxy-N-acetyl-beta-L-altrosamine transaminase
MNRFLPYGRQQIDDDDIAAVNTVLRGDWLTTGPAVDAFEDKLALAVGARHAIACSSGTAALHLAAMAAGIGEGDIAIVPSMTFVATANCVRYAGGEARIADVNATTGLIEAEEIARQADHAGGGVKAVFPVHLNGQACAMDTIAEMARARGMMVIEDASHALGTSLLNDGSVHPIGSCSHSDMCVFSFHPVKTIAMGEGGAITTNDDGLAHRLRELRAHGITREPGQFVNSEAAFDDAGNPHRWYYEAQALGFNYRASDIHCALGTSQLGKLPQFARRRRDLARQYDEQLSGLAPAIQPVERVEWSDSVMHLYPVLIDFTALGRSRDDVVAALLADGIGTQVHYIPVHMQPYYQQRYGRSSLPGAESYYESVLSLPLFAGMEKDDVNRVTDTLRKIIGNA